MLWSMKIHKEIVPVSEVSEVQFSSEWGISGPSCPLHGLLLVFHGMNKSEIFSKETSLTNVRIWERKENSTRPEASQVRRIYP